MLFEKLHIVPFFEGTICNIGFFYLPLSALFIIHLTINLMISGFFTCKPSFPIVVCFAKSQRVSNEVKICQAASN